MVGTLYVNSRISFQLHTFFFLLPLSTLLLHGCQGEESLDGIFKYELKAMGKTYAEPIHRSMSLSAGVLENTQAEHGGKSYTQSPAPCVWGSEV